MFMTHVNNKAYMQPIAPLMMKKNKVLQMQTNFYPIGINHKLILLLQGTYMVTLKLTRPDTYIRTALDDRLILMI